jgi:hypothetical protein
LVRIKNNLQIDFKLKLRDAVDGFEVPEKITHYADKISLLPVRKTTDSNIRSVELSLPYLVENMLIRPDNGLPADIMLSIKK